MTKVVNIDRINEIKKMARAGWMYNNQPRAGSKKELTIYKKKRKGYINV